jgi:hypothetical protein
MGGGGAVSSPSTSGGGGSVVIPVARINGALNHTTKVVKKIGTCHQAALMVVPLLITMLLHLYLCGTLPGG